MNKAAEPHRVGRPRDVAKAERIVEAAWELFLTHGVEVVSMESIARQAGVSKVTVYATYTDKAQLFAVCLQREMSRIESAQGIYERQAEHQGLYETLHRFGIGLMTFLATDSAISFYGTLAAELRRSPLLAKSFWDVGPGKTQRNLADILSRASHQGDITIDDSLEAAETLIGLWQGLSNFQLALGIDRERDDDVIEARVKRGVEVFLRAYANPQS